MEFHEFRMPGKKWICEGFSANGRGDRTARAPYSNPSDSGHQNSPHARLDCLPEAMPWRAGLRISASRNLMISWHLNNIHHFTRQNTTESRILCNPNFGFRQGKNKVRHGSGLFEQRSKSLVYLKIECRNGNRV